MVETLELSCRSSDTVVEDEPPEIVYLVRYLLNLDLKVGYVCSHVGSYLGIEITFESPHYLLIFDIRVSANL